MCLVCILSLLRALLVVVREMARYRLRRVPGIGVLRHERVCTVCSYTETAKVRVGEGWCHAGIQHTAFPKARRDDQGTVGKLSAARS